MNVITVTLHLIPLLSTCTFVPTPNPIMAQMYKSLVVWCYPL